MVKSFLLECPVLLRERLGIRFELAHLNSISQEEEHCVERLERRKAFEWAFCTRRVTHSLI
jgi:hypothetical protein